MKKKIQNYYLKIILVNLPFKKAESFASLSMSINCSLVTFFGINDSIELTKSIKHMEIKYHKGDKLMENLNDAFKQQNIVLQGNHATRRCAM